MDKGKAKIKGGRVNGIQHLGVGTADLVGSWKWYKKKFGLDIAMFDDVAEAPLMDIYTNNKTVNKRAAMVFNLQGGTAMEIVELRSSQAKKPDYEVQLGDLGIFAGKIKVPKEKFDEAATKLIEEGDGILGKVHTLSNGSKMLNLVDPNNLFFQLVEGEDFFTKGPHATAGICGCMIGCSNMEASREFYAALGYDEVVFEEEGYFEDYKDFPGGKGKFKRCLLTQKGPIYGGFSQILGKTYIELVQVLDREPKKIYEGRIWGDTGFVHLGFDVSGMDAVEQTLLEIGNKFTCDSSASHHMGKTRVRCVYVEDPDGTLIELTEVYKMPIIEKWGLFLNLEKRDPAKPIPSWMLKMTRFTRIKNNYWEKNNK